MEQIVDIRQSSKEAHNLRQCKYGGMASEDFLILFGIFDLQISMPAS
jgi:hypothetical protein